MSYRILSVSSRFPYRGNHLFGISSPRRSSRSKIRVAGTGGTISMKSERTGQTATSLGSYFRSAGYQFVDICQKDSSQITLKDLNVLLADIQSFFSQGDNRVYVVPHGTDTIEQTALFLRYTLQDTLTKGNHKVLLVGSMDAAYGKETLDLAILMIETEFLSLPSGSYVFVDTDLYAAPVTKMSTHVKWGKESAFSGRRLGSFVFNGLGESTFKKTGYWDSFGRGYRDWILRYADFFESRHKTFLQAPIVLPATNAMGADLVEAVCRTFSSLFSGRSFLLVGDMDSDRLSTISSLFSGSQSVYMCHSDPMVKADGIRFLPSNRPYYHWSMILTIGVPKISYFTTVVGGESGGSFDFGSRPVLPYVGVEERVVAMLLYVYERCYYTSSKTSQVQIGSWGNGNPPMYGDFPCLYKTFRHLGLSRFSVVPNGTVDERYGPGFEFSKITRTLAKL